MTTAAVLQNIQFWHALKAAWQVAITEQNESARRAFSRNLSVTQCDVVCSCQVSGRERSQPALNGRAHALTACVPPFRVVRDASDQDHRSGWFRQRRALRPGK